MTVPTAETPLAPEPRQIAQNVNLIFRNYLSWNVAQTALALTASNPVEFFARQAKLNAAVTKQWCDRLTALMGPAAKAPSAVAPARAAPAPAAIQSQKAAEPAMPAVQPAAPVRPVEPVKPAPQSIVQAKVEPPKVEAPRVAAPQVAAPQAVEPAVGPGVAAALSKLRDANGKTPAKLATPPKDAPVAGKLEFNRADAASARNGSAVSQENAAKNKLAQKRKPSAPSKTPGKRI
jgi:hypothetical protein